MSRRKPQKQAPVQQVQPKKKSFRSDGYSNVFLGHQTKNDPMSKFSFVSSPRMTDNLLRDLYKNNAIARKIIDMPSNESVKNWIKVEADKNNYIIKALDKLGARQIYSDSVRWSRLFGGSCILILADDGNLLEDPLDEDNLLDIEQLRVFDRTQIFWEDTLVNDDPRDINYGQAEWYQINPIGGMPFYVHHSRLLMFNGDPIPDYDRIQNRGFGLPSLQGMWDELVNNSHCMALAIIVMERKGQSVLKLAGLADTLMEESGDLMVKSRLELIDMARGLLNTIAIDADDDFDIKNLSISGMSDLIDRFGFALSAVSNVPFVLLMGHNPKGAGLSQSGGTDLENFYNFVNGQIQERQLKKPLYRLIKLLMKCKNSKFKGDELEDWDLTFNPLWNPSDTEVAQSKKDLAQAALYNSQSEVLRVQNKIVSIGECQRQSGFTVEEISLIEKEKKLEFEEFQEDLIGHSFAKQPAKLSDVVK